LGSFYFIAPLTIHYKKLFNLIFIFAAQNKIIAIAVIITIDHNFLEKYPDEEINSGMCGLCCFMFINDRHKLEKNNHTQC
jgi:hypothetical protein